MGNEQSQMPGMEIDQRVIEVSDFWAQHSANIDNLENPSKLSIFASDLFVNEPFWAPLTPLEKFSKNLMIYRHPCILRYVSSWQRACKFYLAIEEATPLSHVIAHMNTMEICLGLYSILKALCFLHEKALVSHNNLCLASIFVSKEGSWKLGGMEYLCRYKDLTADYLNKSRTHRYLKAVDLNEDKHLKQCSEIKDFIDVFSFCTLVLELLTNKSDVDFPNLSSFKEYCTQVVQEPDVLQRPKLSFLLEHEFFKHKFIGIHSYLVELPLKSDSDKTEFFTNLKGELQTLDEEVVASQLGKLLVSRMVLLNKAARHHLLPYILIPRRAESGPIFSEQVFKKYISPQLLNIICVRDAQIRILLLEYFPHFIECFSKEELQSHILPELLLGIKDTNNELVAATLHTLAELVPVLGAGVVIGGKRAKLFNDGRPKNNAVTSRKVSRSVRLDIPEAHNLEESNASSSMAELIQSQHELPERPRPDGEEGETSTDEIEQSADEDVDNWGDWDNENVTEHQVVEDDDVEVDRLQVEVQSKPLVSVKPKILDITELDIKNQAKIELERGEVDFFEDMEPVIETSSKFLIDNKKITNNTAVSSKLTANIEDSKEEGWGDDWE